MCIRDSYYINHHNFINVNTRLICNIYINTFIYNYYRKQVKKQINVFIKINKLNYNINLYTYYHNINNYYNCYESIL